MKSTQISGVSSFVNKLKPAISFCICEDVSAIKGRKLEWLKQSGTFAMHVEASVRWKVAEVASSVSQGVWNIPILPSPSWHPQRTTLALGLPPEVSRVLCSTSRPKIAAEKDGG
jgi:hypothetical protein